MNFALIQEAIDFLAPRIRRTPLEHSAALSKIAGVPVWMKLEFLQITGSFKLRGAWFRMSRLTAEERQQGIFTCSAGNHGKAIAYAAREMNVKATICVPSSVDEAKYRGMIECGADVRVSKFPGYDETEDWAIASAEREGKAFLSAFDDHAVMAGSGGTLAHEILQDLPDVRAMVVPTGGGGLSAGMSFYLAEKRANVKLVCAQHELSPGLRMSLEQGRAVTRLPAVETSAGGIEGGLGRRPFEILAKNPPSITHLNEGEIENAVRWMLANHQYLIEPSSAVVVAAVLAGKAPLDGPAVLVITGRNVGMKVIERIVRA
jgi:threonine dehydratase